MSLWAERRVSETERVRHRLCECGCVFVRVCAETRKGASGFIGDKIQLACISGIRHHRGLNYTHRHTDRHSHSSRKTCRQVKTCEVKAINVRPFKCPEATIPVE